jgi:Fe-S cluster biogenesis protein NfuA
MLLIPCKNNTTSKGEEFFMKEEVQKVIEEVRPMLQADGGDVELVDVDADTGVVKVKLQGACAGCPGAQMTLQQGIERIVKEKVPGVTKIEQVL